LVAATGGERVCGSADAEFSGIGIDSRAIEPGAVFVALRGERHDGHRFAPAVVDGGVRGLVVARDALPELPLDRWRSAGAVCVAVADTTRALGALAAYQRRRAGVEVAAITGSNGKTSTRVLTAAVLEREFSVLATRGNFNNEIGLPLTLFRLAPDHQWAVLELGMNHPGEIGRLAAICAPRVGVILNIGPAHLQGVGSMEGVLRAKAELVEGMPPGGPAVLNADDPRLRRLGAELDRPVTWFGRSPAADVRAEAEAEGGTGLAFTLVLPDGRVPVRLPLVGRFQVLNALAAAAVGHLAGLDPETIAAGLSSGRPETGRMVPIDTRRGIHLIDDTYNANPASLAAAVETLVAMAPPGRRVLVMGDMLELGPEAPALHREAGARAAAAGVDRLLARGALAEEVAAGAREAGLPADRAVTGAPEALVAELTATLRAGDWVLVKGSRGMAMERILNPLREWADR
jgi:UDP-N-acetylmuramoyl-tripeptide--D-alanyl-D-alanine ligase